MSAILSADDLNDFITPSVACIKPVENNGQGKTGGNGKKLEIEIDAEGKPMEVSKEGNTTRLQRAQISLSDCLACSGCITSSEEVLMQQHSHKEFLKALDKYKGEKTFVASISHQARASLSNALGISVADVDRMLIKLFVDRLGFVKVVGTGLGRRISLKQMSQGIIDALQSNDKDHRKPILTSVCPGWVMYVEKTHPFLLPYMDSTKSPQQITGLLLKRTTAAELHVRPEKVYNLSVMPCFDKKLEAARDERDEQVDVDCVITPKEVLHMLEEMEINLDGLLHEVSTDPSYADLSALYERVSPRYWLYPVESWTNDEGSASGGYAFQYLIAAMHKYAAETSTGAGHLTIRKVEGRNPDIYELELVNTDSGETLARSAVVNGFRNIQNMVRKIKQTSEKGPEANGKGRTALRRRRMMRSHHRRGAEVSGGNDSKQSVNLLKCELIEVMACPEGCINGGGLISGPEDHHSAKLWVDKVLDKYWTIPNGGINTDELESWVQNWLDRFTVCSSRLLKTRFRRVEAPKDNATIAMTSTW